MSEVLREVLMSGLYLALIALVPVAIQVLKKCSEALIDYIDVKSNNEVVNEVLSEIVLFVSDAVSYTMQTYVDSLKKSGQWNEETKKIAFDKAMETAKEFISEESKEMFESVYGDLDKYIGVLIESKVQELNTK